MVSFLIFIHIFKDKFKYEILFIILLNYGLIFLSKQLQKRLTLQFSWSLFCITRSILKEFNMNDLSDTPTALLNYLFFFFSKLLFYALLLNSYNSKKFSLISYTNLQGFSSLFAFKVEENPEATISVTQVKQEPKEPTLSVEAKKKLDSKKLSAT